VGEGAGIELVAAAGLATQADTDDVDDGVAATAEGESDDDVDDTDDAARASLLCRWRRSMLLQRVVFMAKQDGDVNV